MHIEFASQPDDAQATVMHRTAAHLLSTANSSQLEMRILANHGADPRFAFLRGRWPRAWSRIKAGVQQGKGTKAEKKLEGLGGLVGYAGSEDESGASDSDNRESGGTPAAADATREGETKSHDKADLSLDVDIVKEARRARARKWAAQRRAAKNDNHDV